MRKKETALLLFALLLVFGSSCSKRAAESPFDYPFIKQIHINRESGQPYSDYRAFYVLTEDFEPTVESAAEIAQMREVLQYASSLSLKYAVPWTHFVDVNALAPAYISDEEDVKQSCKEMIADLAMMVKSGDDCELHLHGPLNRELFEQLRSEHRLHVKHSGLDKLPDYKQRKSFFFRTFYRRGYQDLVNSLSYGKSLLETAVYDGKQQVLAFRPGGWDHGSSTQDTLLYFKALSDVGLVANSGLVTGKFGSPDWKVGNTPGSNLATVQAGDTSITEVSPTSGPGGYVNPVLPNDYKRLTSARDDEMLVIVSVYHLNALQRTSTAPDGTSDAGADQVDVDLTKERQTLESHFQTVAQLTSEKILYPITLRDLLGIISRKK